MLPVPAEGFTVLPVPADGFTVLPVPAGGFTVLPVPAGGFTVLPVHCGSAGALIFVVTQPSRPGEAPSVGGRDCGELHTSSSFSPGTNT